MYPIDSHLRDLVRAVSDEVEGAAETAREAARMARDCAKQFRKRRDPQGSVLAAQYLALARELESQAKILTAQASRTRLRLRLPTPWGMLTDAQRLRMFDATYPHLLRHSGWPARCSLSRTGLPRDMAIA